MKFFLILLLIYFSERDLITEGRRKSRKGIKLEGFYLELISAFFFSRKRK